MVYLIPFISYLAGSKSVSARRFDTDTMAINAVEASASSSGKKENKSSQYVSHSPPMCRINFPVAKHNANISTAFGCMCNDIVHHVVRTSYQLNLKFRPWLPNTSQYKCLLYQLSFEGQVLSSTQSFNLSATIGHNFNVGWTQGVENGINWNVEPTFLIDFQTHYRHILHRLVTIHK